MKTRSFRIVNVFTRGDERLSGNPLCVFEDGSALDAATMQALALQFNLSETTFILPATDASAGVRIFTPKYEMPFAGHPTLGTAHVCRAMGLAGDSLTLHMPAGIIPVKASGRRTWTLEAAYRGSREVVESRPVLAQMLGVSAQDIGERPLWVNVGTEQMIVPLNSEAAVRKAVVRAELLAQTSADGAGMVYLFAHNGGGAAARFFFSQGNAAVEDPATGSATANFGGWWLALGRALPTDIEISQGEQTGRPSLLRLQVDAQRRILVSGDVIEIGRGTIEL